MLFLGFWILNRKNPEPQEGGVLDYIPIKTFGSNYGFNDNDMLKIVIYLGSKGFDATYSVSGAGIEAGAIFQYIVKVRPEQKMEATRALEEFLSL